jgi:hypothetical protein
MDPEPDRQVRIHNTANGTLCTDSWAFSVIESCLILIFLCSHFINCLLQDAVERLESKEKIEKKLDREGFQIRLIFLIHSSVFGSGSGASLIK